MFCNNAVYHRFYGHCKKKKLSILGAMKNPKKEISSNQHVKTDGLIGMKTNPPNFQNNRVWKNKKSHKSTKNKS